MLEWDTMYEVTREKLKRDLKTEEKEFLKRVYERYITEEIEQSGGK